MLTLEMQKALVKGIRKQQALRLLKERKLLRRGLIPCLVVIVTALLPTRC